MRRKSHIDLRMHAGERSFFIHSTSWLQQNQTTARILQVDFGAVQLKEVQLSCLDEMGDNGCTEASKTPFCYHVVSCLNGLARGFYRCLASIPLSGG